MASPHCASAPTPTTGTPDPIQLQTLALNSLSRCKSTLLANEPMYGFAQSLLADAQQAIAALCALEQQQEG
ncbi:MAG: hypothetical protein RR779_15325 [Comamonas sp.]